MGGAAQAYAQALSLDPANVKALGGLARCYLAGGARDPDLDAVRAALALAEAAPSETAEFDKRLAADTDDHEARFELAKALAGQGRLDEAADHLLTIIERERDWNEDAARKQLLTVFEAAGPTSEVAKQGRRRLSSILFS